MKRAAAGAVIFFGWILIWQLIYILIGRDVLFASPAGVLMNISALAVKHTYYLTIIKTLRNVLLGFICALAFGSGMAVIAYIAPPFKKFVAPMINIMKATPVASFIILALVFMRASNLPVLISFLMVTPLVWSNIIEALNSVDGNLIEMSNQFNVPFILRLRHIYFPTAVPYFWSAFQTGLGYAWKSGITAEVMSSPKMTIGRELADAKVYLDTLSLFSWTVTAVILSILTEKLLGFFVLKALNHYFPKPEKEQGYRYD